MPRTKGKTVASRKRPKWLVPVGWAAVVSIAAAGATIGYAAHLENRNSFCASCHTQPESRYYDQSLGPAVDLASAHAAQGVMCIQCHSGRGALGRVAAMASVALPDLLAFQSGSYRDPAVTTRPAGDDHCLKCHGGVESGRDFNNHFHAFLPLWQAQAGRQAAGCVDCHVSHVAGGDPRIRFLTESATRQICDRCHAFAA